MKNQIPNTKTQIPRSGKNLEVGAILNDMRRAGLGLGAWNLEFGAWSFIRGPWNLVFGTFTNGYATSKSCEGVNFQEYATSKSCGRINLKNYATSKSCIRIFTHFTINKYSTALKLNQL